MKPLLPQQLLLQDESYQLEMVIAYCTRAPLAAGGTATCSCVQTCKIRLWDTPQIVTMESGEEETKQDYNFDKQIRFWLRFSTACGPFNQIDIYKDSLKLWDTSIYVREQTIISSNSLNDQCTSNDVTVSLLESIVQSKRHCDSPVLTRNYASLRIQLWMQDFLQDLKIEQLNKYNPVDNSYLVYVKIPPEKLNIIQLKNRTDDEYSLYCTRLVNMEGKPNTTTIPTATISQIENAKFNELNINNLCFNMENEGVIVDMILNQRLINFPTQVLQTQSSNYPASNIGDGGGFIQTIMSLANIKSMFVTFATLQYTIWIFPASNKNIDLIMCQRHVIPSAYLALSQDVCEQISDCFVDQNVVSASSDLYHSLVIENQHIDDKNCLYGIENLETEGQLRPVSNLFYETTLYKGSKAVKVFYTNKFMLAWKLATDDSFMRGYNSSKIGARTNIQIQIGFKSIDNICTDEPLRPALIDQNDFKYFTSTRCYPNIKNSKLTPLNHYQCDGIVRIMFDDNPDLQVLSLEVIGEIGGSAIRYG
ncbi:MAG: hypothetical protein EZS28_019584 [Streblomastix strix]|uniref:Uncharacterized protein n=1 Tax=Streblomastix strix TaxID=222440 RepID=A0A5J4VR22_9EUKA|nr:MAG: hypothetical protein EZS28_019584 [Streblomastix strix]